MTAPFVLLDRDGVINFDSDQFIKSPSEWRPIPGSLEAIALLNESGFRVAVISNQSGLARGLFSLESLQQIHEKMTQSVINSGGKIEAIYYCPHGPTDQCACRKPKPGLFRQFAEEYQLELNYMPFIGDSITDIQAARAATAKPMLVKTGKGLKTFKENPDLDIPVFENLYEAAKFILSGQ